MRKLANWFSVATMGVAAGVVSGWEPPPPVLVENPKAAPQANLEGAPEMLPPAMAVGSPYDPHGANCDCRACQPFYLFPRRACGDTLLFRPDGYWNTVAKPKLQYSHWGYCDKFCERPFGVAVQGHVNRQIVNGLSQQLMLYEYDFQDVGLAELNPRGHYQLEKIAQRYQHGLGPVLIASNELDPQLDAARRQVVARELNRMGINVTTDQVLVRRQPRPSFNAYESLSIQRNREQAVQQRGVGGLSGAASNSNISGS